MNPAQIDFQQIRIKHILFKSKVRSVLYGGAYDEAFFSRSGPVNQWFSTIGLARYSQEPDMKELTRINNDLHATALQLFGLYKAGRIDQALEGLQQVNLMSDNFLALVAKLEARYNT